MPNQLLIPFKKTYLVEIRRAVRTYLLAHDNETHPDALKWDITRWETLRKDGVGGSVHADKVNAALSYHAQLVFILTKLPSNIGLEVPYAPAFDPSALPITLPSIVYERAAVIFNLAALYSQLASTEDRSNPTGLKQAIQSYQQAAGTLQYLSAAPIQALQHSVSEDDMPLELTPAFVLSLRDLMLAQAQECVWQRAVMDSYKNGIIAKLAGKVASLYQSSANTLREASPAIKHLFPSFWLPHLEAKQNHFDAASQYRKSVDDLEAHRYGHEIARLTQAQSSAKKGYDYARKGGVATAVLQDVKSLLDNVQKSLARAERDNDLIYHDDVPPVSFLPTVQEISMVNALVPHALTDPASVVSNNDVIFGELAGWGVRTTIDLYKDRRKNWIQEEINGKAEALDSLATQILRSLNLPTALEVLEKPIGLPPSLLKKAEEVRLDDGPARIEASIEDVHKLSRRDVAILNEAMDILDQEAEDDENFQTSTQTKRIPSHEANKMLTEQAQRYRSILDRAVESDGVVKSKWDQWEKNVIELTWDEADLEASVPSSTVSKRWTNTGKTNPTQIHARALRVLLESLDDLQRARVQAVSRANRLVESDDVTSRIMKAASTIELWTEAQPSMFEDVLDQELLKYEKFRLILDENSQMQEALLDSIKERNALFLQSRQEDSTIKEREHALQSLDLAYHKYKEIRQNLDEGLKFYNDFATILVQFRESCRQWVNARRDEIHTLALSMESVSLQSQPEEAAKQIPAAPQRQAQPGVKPVLDLPPPNSDQWEAAPLPPNLRHGQAKAPKRP